MIPHQKNEALLTFLHLACIKSNCGFDETSRIVRFSIDQVLLALIGQKRAFSLPGSQNDRITFKINKSEIRLSFPLIQSWQIER